MSLKIYAYTFPAAMEEFEGYILVKIGKTRRSIDARLSEGTTDFQEKVRIGSWDGFKRIKSDGDVHNHPSLKPLHYHKEGIGNEWFRIPANSLEEVYEFIDNVITDLEGHRVRASVILRAAQQRALDKLLNFIAMGKTFVVANLCPRFGKTIWALMAFNKIHEFYGNNTMFLPSYWLSSHNSFIDEIKRFNDFNDIVQVNARDAGAEQLYRDTIAIGNRACIIMSLHGDFESWSKTHAWLREIPLESIFSFLDEGDFGAHTPNQKLKLEFLFNRS
jgi:hypothetical protein